MGERGGGRRGGREGRGEEGGGFRMRMLCLVEAIQRWQTRVLNYCIRTLSIVMKWTIFRTSLSHTRAYQSQLPHSVVVYTPHGCASAILCCTRLLPLPTVRAGSRARLEASLGLSNMYLRDVNRCLPPTPCCPVYVIVCYRDVWWLIVTQGWHMEQQP